MKRNPLPVVLGLVIAVLVAVLAAGQVGLLGAASSASAGPSSAVATATPRPTETAGAVVEDSPSPTPSEAPATPAPPAELADVPVVPVTNFRATPTSTSAKELKAVLAGTSDRYTALELVESEADAILSALGADRPSDPARLILAPDAKTLAADLAKNRKRLAFLRADAVGPEVRALAWGDAALFGVDRVKTLADWPLTASLPAPTAADAFDPATTWTLFAGGDIMLDRGVYLTLKDKGADFAFDGGTATITGRCKNCSPLGWDTPYTKRTGDAGVVRDLIKGADIAAANFENPAPNNPRFHASGTNFSADPRLIDGLKNAGIDYVSLANNHIRDAGATGLLQTIANVKKRGIRYSGAGKDANAARTPAILEAAGPRSRSSATTRSPAATTRPRPRSAAPGCRRRPSKPTWRRRARPAPTSSSSTRTGAPSTTRPPSSTRRSWPR